MNTPLGLGAPLDPQTGAMLCMQQGGPGYNYYYIPSAPADSRDVCIFCYPHEVLGADGVCLCKSGYARDPKAPDGDCVPATISKVAQSTASAAEDKTAEYLPWVIGGLLLAGGGILVWSASRKK